jgi:hypothetical protein
MKDYSSHFRELVEFELPEDSHLLMPRGGQDMMILATWRLSTDAFRASKRSRMIRIVIAEEAIQGYARGSEGARLASDGRFAACCGASWRPSTPIMIHRWVSNRRP